MSKRLTILFLAILSIAGGIFFGLWFQAQRKPVLSPISTSTVFRFLPGYQDKLVAKHRLVYGYLPYWNLNKVTLQPELDKLAYFGLLIGGDGSVVTKLDGGTEPGYQKWNSEAVFPLLTQQRANGGQTELVLAMFNQDDIPAFLNSPSAQQRLLSQLDSLLMAYPIQGINIDIEMNGGGPELRQKLVTFTQQLRTHLNQSQPAPKLSMAVYASAASRPQIWDIAALAPNLDYFVVMAYDFHRRSSPVAGPVAPIFGGKELWDSDISTHLKDLLKIAPKEKILLGIPFYGYEWQTTDRQPQAHTFPETGATASFQRVQEILAQRDDLKVEEGWNETALSPYITYQKGKDIYVIYYENSRSISYKLDLVNQLDLAGVAIWALGYEGESRELWDVIQRKIH